MARKWNLVFGQFLQNLGYWKSLELIRTKNFKFSHLLTNFQGRILSIVSSIVIQPEIIVKYVLYQHSMCIIIFDTRGVKSWCWVKLNLSNQYSTNILLPKLELKRDLRKTLITIWRDYPTKTQIVRNSAFFVTFLSNLCGRKEK